VAGLDDIAHTLATCSGPRWLACCCLGCWADWSRASTGLGLDDQPERSRILVDFIVVGGIFFTLTMVLTYAIGCWITAVMHGPRRDGDVSPSDQGMPRHDD